MGTFSGVGIFASNDAPTPANNYSQLLPPMPPSKQQKKKPSQPATSGNRDRSKKRRQRSPSSDAPSRGAKRRSKAADIDEVNDDPESSEVEEVGPDNGSADDVNSAR
jgi:hypothetical protein